MKNKTPEQSELTNQIYNNLLNHAKDEKALKNNKYNKIKDDFTKSFILKNKKTNQIMQIKAASAIHAANILGWKPKNTIVVGEV